MGKGYRVGATVRVAVELVGAAMTHCRQSASYVRFIFDSGAPCYTCAVSVIDLAQELGTTDRTLPRLAEVGTIRSGRRRARPPPPPSRQASHLRRPSDPP